MSPSPAVTLVRVSVLVIDRFAEVTIVVWSVAVESVASVGEDTVAELTRSPALALAGTV